jgi:phosphoserine phosphatase
MLLFDCASQPTEDKALTTRVILVRHGESTYNVQRIVQGHCDESFLTEAGRNAASQVGTALQGIQFDAAYSSPLKRAKETADLILSNRQEANPPLQLRDDLKEINLALWEGMSFQEVEAKFPEAFLCWRDRPHELCMQIPTAEGTQDFYPVPALYEQARAFWQDRLPQHQDGNTILVIAHSGIIRALINTAVGLEPPSYHTFHISNCGVSVLNFAGTLGEPVQLESINLTAQVGEPLPKPRSGQRGVRILLIRHGETDWNRDKRFQGQIDVPLNQRGQLQAEQAATFLATETIDRAVSSPLLRPKQTAQAILQHHPHLELEFANDLKEISHGLWEGKLEAEIEQGYPGLLHEWQRSPHTVQMPEGENLQQVWDRAIAAWKAIVASTQGRDDRPTTVLVSAHDAVNKAILCDLVGWGPEKFWVFKQGNGAVSVIDYPQGAAGEPIVKAMNITSHLGGVIDRTAAGAL